MLYSALYHCPIDGSSISLVLALSQCILLRHFVCSLTPPISFFLPTLVSSSLLLLYSPIPLLPSPPHSSLPSLSPLLSSLCLVVHHFVEKYILTSPAPPYARWVAQLTQTASVLAALATWRSTLRTFCCDVALKTTSSDEPGTVEIFILQRVGEREHPFL